MTTTVKGICVKPLSIPDYCVLVSMTTISATKITSKQALMRGGGILVHPRCSSQSTMDYEIARIFVKRYNKTDIIKKYAKIKCC